MNKNNGGPAFPCTVEITTMIEHDGYAHSGPVQAVHHVGMSLRDYFAAKAMEGMLSNPRYEEICTDFSGEEVVKYLTVNSYGFADAMLKAREEK